MKRAGIVGMILLLTVPLTGCACYPRYGGSCALPSGCGSVIHNGVVDYVDGGPGACEADCGGSYAGAGYGGYGYSPYRPCGVSNCANCLGDIVNGIFVLGEGAFCVAASPFVLVGNLICGGYAGYETYPNCGCSNEVYYGDNCYQPHDIADPCAAVGTCGCGGVANSGCARCVGGYTEGVQIEGNVQKQNSGYRQPLTQPVRNPAYNAQINRNRPISQTTYRQPTMQQRLSPPRPQVYADEYQTASAQ